MPGQSSAKIKADISGCLAKHKNVEAGYVFGSVASGRVRPDSDIDVGVLLDDRIRPRYRLNYRLRLMAGLNSLVMNGDGTNEYCRQRRRHEHF